MVNSRWFYFGAAKISQIDVFCGVLRSFFAIPAKETMWIIGRSQSAGRQRLGKHFFFPEMGNNPSKQ
jgi:hypothetical protein